MDETETPLIFVYFLNRDVWEILMMSPHGAEERAALGGVNFPDSIYFFADLTTEGV